jgi:cation transporter-like permease
VILLPVLNDTIGGYGCIISSRFSTMLYEGKKVEKWWKSQELKKLFLQVLIISMLTTSLSSVIALTLSLFSDYAITFAVVLKILFMTLIDAFLLVMIMFISSIVIGLHYYKKNEDPNNFLIPIMTSLADFGNMIILSILVVLLF